MFFFQYGFENDRYLNQLSVKSFIALYRKKMVIILPERWYIAPGKRAPVAISYNQICSCLQCPSKIGKHVTAFGLPILLTSDNTLHPTSFQGVSFPIPFLFPSTMTSIEQVGQKWRHLSPFCRDTIDSYLHYFL